MSAIAVEGQSPVVTYSIPKGLILGQTTRVTFYGTNLSGATGLWANFPAEAVFLGDPDDSATNVSCRITVPKNAPLGRSAVRLIANSGISSFVLMLIDDLPTIHSNGTNKSTAAAQPVKWPVAVEGNCEPLSSDYYQLRAKRGQRLSVEIVAHRLGSPLDGVVRLLDPEGKEVYFCDDDPGIGADSRFAYRFTKSGNYLLELRDIGYQGGPQHQYRARIGHFPLITVPFPLGAQRGMAGHFHFAGKSVERLRAFRFDISADLDDSRIARGVKFRGGKGSGFFTLLVSDQKELIESEPNDEPQSSCSISLPNAINGRFEKAGDRDYYQFQTGANERWIFSGMARRLGSPCDLFLALFDSQGTEIAKAAISGANEATLTNAFTRPGIYRLLVDELNHFGGPEMAYRVGIQKFSAGFDLSVEVEKLEAGAGEICSVKVKATRRDYEGPINLGLAGLGEDEFVLENPLIPAKENETELKIRVSAKLRPGHMRTIRILGRATIGDTEYTAVASTLPALRKLFPLFLYPPPELDGLIGLGIKPKVQKSPQEARSKLR